MTVNLGLFARCLLLFLSSGAQERRSTERNYYVGIVEDFWDYAPSGKNLLNGKSIESDEHARVFLERGPHRIGRVYKKAMFREFTDASYSSQVPRPKWLGFLGPILRAEVDDVIVVHLKNFASRNFTMHPHGLFYEKNAEGAFYPDGTSNALKQDDSVPPGGSYTYRWEVKPEFAPTDDDSNCLTWIYHSHLETPKDIASGLIGPLLTCKKGTLKQINGILVRTDVDKDVFLMFNVVDENLSWYLNENIQRLSDPDGVDTEDPDFEESNLMHSINGFTYGNLPGIQMCQHRTVSWHLFGIGNEVDIHSAFFHGNTLLDRGHRTDTISLFPATFVTAEMVPLKAGKWLLACQVNDHLQAGMQAFYEVKPCASEGSSTALGGVVRDFYVAAEKVLWNYAPSEKDLINNVPLIQADSASEVFFGTEGGRIGGSYFKVMYREYTDNTFTTLKSPVHSPVHLGILGPVLRAEVGDTLRVTFMNRAEGNFSIQPHGLHYEKQFQGTSYMDGVNKPGSHVGQGETFTYIWQVLEGPSSSDTPCIPYLYYSATDPTKDTNSGLVGPLLICRKGVLAENGIQKGVDKEFFLLFSVMDENLSWYLDENIERSGINTEEENEDFEESNKMHAINGFMYGNLMGLEMCVGDKVMWYTFGLGTEADIHGVYFEGNTFKKQSTTRDTLSLFPHTTAAVSMQPNSPGVYEVSCRTTDHFSAGMRQKYKVNLCPGNTYWHKYTTPRRTVQYFIGAEEIVWDYSPDRQWEFEKHHTTAEDSPGNIFVVRGKNRIGSRYKKVVYREYTDETFKIQKERHPDEQHLGIMGPIIKGEVGEEIVITFKNKASRPYSISPHGVKASGAHTPVAPGHIIELTWDIPESSGPGITDPNCISYAYYSSVNFIKDLYSGLLGPLVICRRGTLKRGKGSERQRRDIAKEFALLFMIYDENQSWYLDDNIKTYLGIDPEIFTPDEDFEESNLMHGINGKLYGNLHGLVMTQGQKVDWYLLGMGNEVDLHTVHFHAEAFTYKTDRVHRTDVFDLFPGTFQTVEMVVGNPGTWLLHCHVSDHIHAGMETTFTINERLYSQAAPRAEVSISMLILSLAFGLSAVARLY